MYPANILDSLTLAKTKNKTVHLVLFYCSILIPVLTKILWYYILPPKREHDFFLSPELLRLMTTIRIVEVVILLVFIIFGFFLIRREQNKIHRIAITILLILLGFYFINNIYSLYGLAGLYLNGTLS